MRDGSGFRLVAWQVAGPVSTLPVFLRGCARIRPEDRELGNFAQAAFHIGKPG